MNKVIGFFGSLVIVGLVYLFAKDKKNINWKSVGLAYVGQFILAFLLLKTPLWKGIEVLSDGMNWLISMANTGIDFVFGGIAPDGFVFFINSLMPIIFLSSLFGLMFHFGILQKFINTVGRLVAKIFDIHPLVGINGISNVFLGQSDSLLVTKSYMPHASDSVIFATMVGGLTSVSASVLGLYSGLGCDMEFLLISMPMTVVSTLVVCQIAMPTRYNKDEEIKVDNDKGINFIETMLIYANAAFKSVIAITVALLVFLSFVTLVNSLIGIFFPSVTLESILGIFFTPLAWLMGVPSEEVMMVSQIMATKLVTNEVVSFGLPVFNELSANTKAMVTVFNTSFAGFGSIAILIGGMSAVAPNKVQTVARLGIYALLLATLVNFLSASVIGLFL